MQDGDDAQIQRWLSLLRDGSPEEKIDPRFGLAQIFEHRGMYEEATELLISNVHAGARSADLFRWLARLYRNQGQEVLAMQAAAEAAKYMPPARDATPAAETFAPVAAPKPVPAVPRRKPGMLAPIVTVALMIVVMVGLYLWDRLASAGGPASQASAERTAADNGVSLVSRLGENPLRSGPHQFGGGSYRVEWRATDVTPREPCAGLIWIEPTGTTPLGGRTPVARMDVPAGLSSNGSGTKRLTAGAYDVVVMSGCGEWSVNVHRE